MRKYSFVLFVLCFCAGPVSALTEYNYLDQGVAIQFPAKPEAQPWIDTCPNVPIEQAHEKLIERGGKLHAPGTRGLR